MTVGNISLYDLVLTVAVSRGMDYNEAKEQLEAWVQGNRGAYTARIDRIITYVLNESGL